MGKAAYVILLQRLLRRRLGIGKRNERKWLAGRGEAVVVDGRDLGADGEREARLDVLELHVVEHNRLEVALGLRGAVERDELLRLDCEGERWAARERGVALRGKRQRFEARILQIDLSASGVGDHVPLAFWRHS